MMTEQDHAAFARDWVTLWQSELAAMAQDREMQENWARFAQLWAKHAAGLVPFDPARFPGFPMPNTPFGQAGTAAPPGAAPAAAASAELEQLRQRVAELEQRLAQLESRAG